MMEAVRSGSESMVGRDFLERRSRGSSVAGGAERCVCRSLSNWKWMKVRSHSPLRLGGMAALTSRPLPCRCLKQILRRHSMKAVCPKAGVESGAPGPCGCAPSSSRRRASFPRAVTLVMLLREVVGSRNLGLRLPSSAWTRHTAFSRSRTLIMPAGLRRWTKSSTSRAWKLCSTCHRLRTLSISSAPMVPSLPSRAKRARTLRKWSAAQSCRVPRSL
mmetsp:Transcript_113767/g.332269  ORF Transcript_113767/g.332269 Transcript_113767/m.332269 type:complete len:217 (+) Transcript_113767:251-901(+)